MAKKKTIITAAVTGAWPKKENNPNVPMTPAEIADDVYACWQAGAAVAHLHMRDDEGNGTMDHNKFRETVELLHSKYPDCDIILNLTTSGDLNATDETRVEHVKELKPEMASFDCGSMNWMHSGLFINSPKFLTDCGLLFQETNTKPEIEAFDPGMIANAAYYLKKRRSQSTPSLSVLHGMCQRNSRFHKESCIYERNYGSALSRFHVVLLWCRTQRYGDALRSGCYGRKCTRGYGRQRHVFQGRAG